MYNYSCSVHDIAFRPDGEQLIVATGTTVQVMHHNNNYYLSVVRTELAANKSYEFFEVSISYLQSWW